MQELKLRGTLAVTRDSLALPDHYPLMEQNRNKVWADHLGELKLFCIRNSCTLYLVGEGPNSQLWDYYTRTPRTEGNPVL